MACGIGVGAYGFNLAEPRVGKIRGRFECAGGIDVDAGAIRNFEMMTGVKGTVLDLFDRAQYVDFHGKEPPFGWTEATPAMIRRIYGDNLDVAFASMPCKGFSGLLSTAQSKTDKYQALNGLTLRGIWLLLEAYKDDPIPIVLFENVPRIQTRGRWLLNQIIAIFRSYGYSVNEDTHDCGVIGGLAESRKRFLLIARHSLKVPPFVYQPRHHKLRGVGEVIGKLPLPGDPVAGIMHKVPALQWKTWVRLALIPAGKDWRALNDLRVENGVLADYGIVPDHALRDNALGVNRWSDTAGVLTSARAPGQGRFSVADPRPVQANQTFQQYGVNEWAGSVVAITGQSAPGGGPYSVADPRPLEKWHSGVLGVQRLTDTSPLIAGRNGATNGTFSIADPSTGFGPSTHHNVLRVTSYTSHVGVISSATHPAAGAGVVADIRIGGKPRFNSTYRIVKHAEPSPAIAGPGGPGGGLAVADVRAAMHENYSSRKYKVTEFTGTARAVIGASTTGDGAFSVADPRPEWGLNRHRNIMRVTAENEPAGTISGARAVTGGMAVVASSRPHYDTQGHFGVNSWTDWTGSVPGYAKYDRGSWSVADPREMDFASNEGAEIKLPDPDERLVCRIIALDETWHRPFTTLDLAAIQSLFDPEEAFGQDSDGVWFKRKGFELEASSDVTKREWIGNAVPGASARGMAETIGQTLILASLGETFQLSTREIWVKPLAMALTVDNNQVAFQMEQG